MMQQAMMMIKIHQTIQPNILITFLVTPTFYLSIQVLAREPEEISQYQKR